MPNTHGAHTLPKLGDVLPSLAPHVRRVRVLTAGQEFTDHRSQLVDELLLSLHVHLIHHRVRPACTRVLQDLYRDRLVGDTLDWRAAVAS
jgi:hypothetical protein